MKIMPELYHLDLFHAPSLFNAHTNRLILLQHVLSQEALGDSVFMDLGSRDILGDIPLYNQEHQ